MILHTHRLQHGFTQIMLAIIIACVGIVVIGGGLSLGKKLQENTPPRAAPAPSFTQQNFNNATLDGVVLGTVSLADNSFSAYRVRLARISNKKYLDESRITYPNGDEGIGVYTDTIDQFIDLSGITQPARIVCPMVMQIRFSDGRTYPVHFLEGTVVDGKMQGFVRFQMYYPNLLLEGQLQDSKLSKVKMLGPGERFNEIEYLLAKQALEFQNHVSWGDKPKLGQVDAPSVLGVTDPIYFTEDFSTAVMDPKTSTWRVGSTIPGVSGGAALAAPLIRSDNPLFSVRYEGGTVVIQSPPQISAIPGLTTSATIVDQSVTTLDLADGSVTTPILADSAVTLDKLAENSVARASIVDESIDANKLASGAVTNSKIENGAVDSAKISDGTITNTDVSGSAGIVDSKLAQLTTTNKVAGSAIQLSTGGGLANSTGISLVTTCTANQVLAWDGDSWECANQTGSGGGSGDITEVIAGNGLSGGGTTDSVTLSITANSVDDALLAFNTGQHLTTVSSPSFAGLTLTGPLALGNNSVTLGPTTISSTEFGLLDGLTGSVLTSANVGTVLSAWDQDASNDLTTSNYAATLDSIYVNLNEAPSAADIDGSFSGGLTLNANTVGDAELANTISYTGALTLSQSLAADAGVVLGSTSTIGNGTWSIAADGLATSLTATDLSCTNCIGATEIADLALGTDTSGNYVASITAGSGISGTAGSEGATPTVALAALTADWNQSGAFDVSLNNASSELKILESAGATFYGVLDVGDLSADATYTLSGSTGTIVTSANAGSVLSAWDQNASDDLTTANYTTTLDAVYVNVGENPASGDVSGSYTAGLTLGANTVDDSELTNSIAYTGTLTLSQALSANAGITTSTGILPLDSSGALLVAKDNLQAEGAATISGNLAVSGNAVLGVSSTIGNGTWSIDGTGLATSVTATDLSCTNCIGATEISDLALGTDTSGNYVATLTSGNGVSATATGEGSTPTVALTALTADWNQSGAFDLSLNNASAELKILESAGATFYGTIDVGDLSADATYTLSGSSGTLATSANAGSVLSAWDQNASDDLTTSNYTSTLDAVYVNVGENPAVGDISGNFSGGFTVGANTIALTTDTTGNYVATITPGLGISGSSSSEGGTPTIALDVSAALSGNHTLNADEEKFGVSGLIFEGSSADTIETYISVTNPTSTDKTITVPDASGTLLLSGHTFTSDVTATLGSGGTTALTIATDSVALTTDTTGNYVATLTSGNGVSASATGEGSTPTIALAALTADWNQSGAFDVSLNNASSELKILESAGATFFGMLDVGDLAADATYTFSGSSGTVVTSANAGSVLSAWDQDASNDLTTGNYTSTLDAVYVNVDESPAAGDISGSFSGGLTVGANSVALTTDTTGNYVATITSGLGISGSSSTEGGTPTIALDESAALSGDHALSANEEKFGVSGLIFEGSGADTIETYISVTNPTSSDKTVTIPDASGTLLLSGHTFTSDVTATLGSGGTTALTIATDAVALTTDTTGNYVATLTSGNGVSASATGEGSTPTIALAALTADWNQSGAFDVSLNNASSELKILESAGATFFGIFDVGDLAADATYTFSGTSGTVVTSANAASVLSAWDQTASDDLTTGNYTSTLDAVYVNVGESPTAADISGSFSGGLTVAANSVALTTDTTGNYVSSASSNGGLTLTGTEGASLGILLPAATDALSANTSSGSGLELVSAGLTLLQGCSDGQILKWTEATDLWACGADAGAGSSPFSISTGVITKTTSIDKVQLTAAEAGDYGLLIDASVAPTVDILQITNAGQGAATNDVDLASLNFTTANSQTGSNTNAALQIDVTSGTVSSGNPNLYGVSIGNITGQSATRENAIQVGAGWDNAVYANGNVRLAAQTNTAMNQQNVFTRISGTAGTIGGGATTAIASVSAMVVYNGSLYVGTSKQNAAQVYRYNGTSGSWTVVNSTAGTFGGQASIDAVTSMSVFNGDMYIGTREDNAAEIWRYDGGTSWTRVSQSTAGTIAASGTASIDGVTSMTVYNGRLYIGTREIPGNAQIYRYEGGTTWTLVNTTASVLVTTNCTAQAEISAMTVYQNMLVAGTSTVNRSCLLRYNGNVGASVFTVLNSTTQGTYSVNGANVASVDGVTSLVVWNNSLIVGISEGAGGADVYLAEPVTVTTSTQLGFRRLNSAAGTIGSTSTVAGIQSLAVYNGRLYAGTSKANTAEVFRYDGAGTGWTKVSGTTGVLSTGGATNVDSIGRMIPYNDTLAVGSEEVGAGSAEVHSYASVIDQSYKLVFEGSAVNGGGVQNTLQNAGWITFTATPSGNMGSNGQTGTFLFSHSLATQFGAYDVAEDYPTRDDTIEVGDVIAVDINERGMVGKSHRQYDGLLVGVYSQKPALRLTQLDDNIDGAKAIPVALAGRVPVKVSTENGPIAIGDTLTSSSVPGVAMKATKAGSVLGRALEPYDGEGIGKVMTFVNVSSIGGIGVRVAEAIASVDAEGIPIATQSAGLSEIITDRLVASELAVERIQSNSIVGLSELIAEEASRSAHLYADTLFNALHIPSSNEIIAFVRNWLQTAQEIVLRNVTFLGQLTVSRDTAGIAVVARGSQEVTVTFERAYENPPVITVSMNMESSGDTSTRETLEQAVLNNELRYILTNKSESGFTIKLNRTFDADIQFSWTALAVKNGIQRSEEQSIQPSPSPTPEPTPHEDQPQPTPSPSPTQEPTPSLSPTPDPTPTPESSPEPQSSPEPTTSPEPSPTL